MKTVVDLRGKRILIVEDDLFIADDLSVELQKMGAAVVGPARTEAQAIEWLERDGQVDAAVLNIGLRSAPTFNVAARLRALEVPYVFSSGHTRDVVPDEFSDVDFFGKPADPAAIARALFPLMD